MKSFDHLRYWVFVHFLRAAYKCKVPYTKDGVTHISAIECVWKANRCKKCIYKWDYAKKIDKDDSGDIVDL